jgi:hypothetical protein
MKLGRRIFALLRIALVPAAISLWALSAWGASRADGRIFLMMVWDGLRPDVVNPSDTPNLVAIEREGVSFVHHHSVFPTVTMVDAAALATGSDPDHGGIFGDSMYLLPTLGADAASSVPKLGELLNAPLDLENSARLAALNSSGGFNGYLLGVEGVAQQILREGGYVAIVGKQGPTFLFDDQVDRHSASSSNYLFVADDLARPQLSSEEAASKPPLSLGELNSIADRDHWFAGLVIDRALPAARVASSEGRPALIVLWQHNPDLVQHIAGLGTQPALNALRESDANLAAICAAISRLGLAHRTDLMVVSDHGFATIRMSVSLADLLVTAGIKKSADSTDIVIARNGGADFVYLSPAAFESEEARRATLARIVDFAEAQEWCGPIFSKKPSTDNTQTSRQNHVGWIPGTFAQEVLELYNLRRSPDLIISFRELPAVDNRSLTGPENPAFALGARGQVVQKNASFPLVRPIQGVVYSDVHLFSAGQGMHGAAGARELHNFCAANGPDFRRRFIDQAPSGNDDVAPTIRRILNLDAPAGASGRVLQEALSRPRPQALPAQQETIMSYLVLQGQEIVTKLLLTQFEGRTYLDDSSVTRNSLNGSP